MRIVNISFQSERCFCLPCTTIVFDQWRPSSDHWGDHCAAIRRPRQSLSHHGYASASTLPPLSDLSCLDSKFGGSGKTHMSCCKRYTEAGLSGFRRPGGVLVFFWSLKGGTRRSQPCGKRASTHTNLSITCTLLRPWLWKPQKREVDVFYGNYRDVWNRARCDFLPEEYLKLNIQKD